MYNYIYVSMGYSKLLTNLILISILLIFISMYCNRKIIKKSIEMSGKEVTPDESENNSLAVGFTSFIDLAVLLIILVIVVHAYYLPITTFIKSMTTGTQYVDYYLSKNILYFIIPIYWLFIINLNSLKSSVKTTPDEHISEKIKIIDEVAKASRLGTLIPFLVFWLICNWLF